ncbi:MAG: FtsX-like permease family protein [Bacteroidota bacterium]
MNSEKWLERVLGLFCPPELQEEIEGDLLQKFAKDKTKLGNSRAKLRLLLNTIKFFRPGIVFRNHLSFKRNSMIFHYITLSFRSILRNKVFSSINVIGLAVGLIAFFLIIQYVTFEMGFDRFHKDHEQLYRVVHRQVKNSEVINSSAKSYIGVRQLLHDHFPDVTTTSFVDVPIDLGITYGYKGKTLWNRGKMIQADTMFFKVFPDLLVKGDPATILTSMNGVVLSEKLSFNTFGHNNPVGELLDDAADINESDSADVIEVTGVFKDLPAESHFKFEAIRGIETDGIEKFYWETPGCHTYIRISSSSDANQIQSRLNELLAEVAKSFPNIAGAQVSLQPISDIHTTPGIGDELTPTTDTSLPLILSAIALCILFIAWINYINLETARFVTQAKEVGMRRVIGSTRKELALQHIIRYLVLNVIAFTIAAIGIILIIPYFSDLTGIPIDRLTFNRPVIWISALSLYLFGSIIVGCLPALMLLKLNPASIMKGNILPSASSGKLRTSLVVVQYVASISLIIFVVVANDQLNFMRSANKKLDIEHVIAIENPLAYSGNFEGNWDVFPALEEAFRNNPAFSQICMSSNVPGRPINFTLVNDIKRHELDAYNPTRFKLLFIDHSYMDLYNVKMKAGRSYNYHYQTYDENDLVIVLNESAVYALGFKSAEEAIDQHVWLNLWGSKDRKIIGVVEDHYHESVKQLVPPTIYYPNSNAHQQVYFSIRLNKGADVQEALTFIEAAYKKVLPKNPFAYFFIDELYDKQFQSDLHFARVFGLFSGVALFLACLGILGITLFEANTRLKEISIRKILGASVTGIVTMLSKKHIRVITISLLVATPLAFYASSQWLLEYPVRISLTAMPFVIAGASITILTLAASIAQTIKAASTTPVDHLKNE